MPIKPSLITVKLHVFFTIQQSLYVWFDMINVCIFQMVLSNGAIITAVVSNHTGDVDRILVDRTLVGKLSADNPADGKWPGSSIKVPLLQFC